jgi:Tfp pilus assembly protein PilW
MGPLIPRRSQRGQSMNEYLVALLVAMMMIGISFGGGESVITLFLRSVKTAFDRLSGFLSIPL